MPLTKEQEQKIKDVIPMDDLTIQLMLRRNPKLAELICRIILDDKTLKVCHVETQYDASGGGIARDVTIDAVIEEEGSRIHHIELQLKDRGLRQSVGKIMLQCWMWSVWMRERFHSAA